MEFRNIWIGSKVHACGCLSTQDLKVVCCVVCGTLTVSLLLIDQVVSGHGLDVPLSVRSNGSAISFLFDGKASHTDYSFMFYKIRNQPSVDCDCSQNGELMPWPYAHVSQVT